jgi:hypothetical protein
MRHSKFIALAFATIVCTAMVATDVNAQSRGGGSRGGSGGGSHGGSGGGNRGGAGRAPTVGRAVPRTGGAPRVQGPHGNGGRSYGYARPYGYRGYVAPYGRYAPLRSYYYPYYGYGYGYRPGLSFGVSFGYPYYGYGYGYPYAYGLSYGGYYPYGYGAYGYGRYAVAAGGYGYGGDPSGGIRIQGAARGVQVYVDGYYAGIVDDFDGTFQRLSLEDGAHQIELRAPGLPPVTYDVNVQPGQTVTIHANVR